MSFIENAIRLFWRWAIRSKRPVMNVVSSFRPSYIVSIQCSDGHTYAWRYTNGTYRETMRNIVRDAASKDHPLTFSEAARLTKDMRDLADEQETARESCEA